MNDFRGRHFEFLHYKRHSEDKQVGNFTLFQANIRVYIGRKGSQYKRKRQIYPMLIYPDVYLSNKKKNYFRL